MNGKQSKRLRRMAAEEMSGDGPPKRELVIARFRGHDRIINEPLSVHAFTKHLKRAYKKAASK